MNTRPKIPANARNLNVLRHRLVRLGQDKVLADARSSLQAHSSYVVVDPKGGTLDQCGRFLQREKYKVQGVQQYRLFKIHALQSAGLYHRRKAMF